VTGPWARALLERHQLTAAAPTAVVTDLRVEPSLITARVDGRPVTLSAPPIAPGVWAAIDGSVTADRQSESLAQQLEHIWDEPLVPEEVVRVGSRADVAAVEGAWHGGELPPLPAPARRPPDSVPKRFGASGIATSDGDLVEVLVRAYAAFRL
jgi:hypothetical protein